MLILALGAVVLGCVFLVISFLTENTGWAWGCIAACGLAAVVLVVDTIHRGRATRAGEHDVDNEPTAAVAVGSASAVSVDAAAGSRASSHAPPPDRAPTDRGSTEAVPVEAAPTEVGAAVPDAKGRKSRGRGLKRLGRKGPDSKGPDSKGAALAGSGSSRPAESGSTPPLTAADAASVPTETASVPTEAAGAPADAAAAPAEALSLEKGAQTPPEHHPSDVESTQVLSAAGGSPEQFATDADTDHGAEPDEEDVDAADALAVGGLSTEVLVVDEHPRFHLDSCPWLADKPTLPLPVGEAVELGFTGCARCQPSTMLAAQARAR